MSGVYNEAKCQMLFEVGIKNLATCVIAKASLKCFTDFSHRFFLVGAVTTVDPGSSSRL